MEITVFEMENRVTIMALTKPPSQIEPVFLKKSRAEMAASGRMKRKFHSRIPASAEGIGGFVGG